MTVPIQHRWWVSCLDGNLGWLACFCKIVSGAIPSPSSHVSGLWFYIFVWIGQHSGRSCHVIVRMVAPLLVLVVSFISPFWKIATSMLSFVTPWQDDNKTMRCVDFDDYKRHAMFHWWDHGTVFLYKVCKMITKDNSMLSHVLLPEHGIPNFISFMRARNPVFWPKRA